MAGPVISARELSLVFQTADAPVYALSKVNLEVEDGDFVSFIGPSGCGKTTLLRVIADLEQATSGTITVNGMTPQEARLKRAYGYVFQAPALYPWRTVERNVGLPLEIMGLDHAAERIAKNLELVNLRGFEKKFPWQLSGGMQQRVSIARALAFDPKLIGEDKLPASVLDLARPEWKGRVAISFPASATPMTMLVPQPRWQHSSAVRITSVLPVQSKL